MSDKFTLRKDIQKQRQGLSLQTYQAMSLSCFELLKQVLRQYNYHSIGIYMSMKNEVDTRPVIEYLWSLKKEVYIPKCEKQGIMHFYQIDNWEDVMTGSYGILEPKFLKNQCDQLDVMIVPLIGVNKEGYRLGIGGGYYDRFMEKYPTLTIGLGYSFQQIPFQQESHDMKFDILITEKEVIYFE